MKKINIFLTIVIGLTIIASLWFMFSHETKPSVLPEEISKPQENFKKETVFLVIDEGEGSPKNFEVEFKKGMAAFELLKTKAEELNLVLKTKTYDIGVLIEAIGEKENGKDGKYWLYYVNGEMPMVSADKKEIKPGDKVEFKFEKSPF